MSKRELQIIKTINKKLDLYFVGYNAYGNLIFDFRSDKIEQDKSKKRGAVKCVSENK